jgi:hypothetical protein
MDVYSASTNMIAFSEFMVAAVKATFGDKADARAEVAGFGQGSFLTDLVFSVGGPLATVFSAVSPKELLEVVKESFALWKHLKGAPPASIEHHGQQVTVTNNNGQIIQVQTETLHLVLSEKGAETAGRFVRQAMEPEGITAIEVSEGREVVVTASRQEAGFFVPVAAEMPLTENTVRMALILEAAVFKDGNKWRFSDGTTSFSADIADKEFLQRVEDGERFGKGDVLTVDMMIAQTRTGQKITAQRTVVKVEDHRPGQEQKGLF